MENTLENKAKFLAIHLNGEFENVNVYGDVHKYSPDGIVKNFLYHRVKPYSVETSHVLLKPLSSINDEDLIFSLKILGTKSILPTDSKEYVEELRDSFIEGFVNYKFYGTFYPFRVIELVDFLRSRGYALPWMELSVEELIEYGWIKLKGENK